MPVIPHVVVGTYAFYKCVHTWDWCLLLFYRIVYIDQLSSPWLVQSLLCSGWPKTSQLNHARRFVRSDSCIKSDTSGLVFWCLAL